MEVFVWISYGHSGVQLSPSQKVKIQKVIKLGLSPYVITSPIRLERMLFTSLCVYVHCILYICECSLMLGSPKFEKLNLVT